MPVIPTTAADESSTSRSALGATRARDWPRPSQAWYVVGVLILVYLVSLIDRQIMTLLVQPIRRDLGISDTQMSLLIGLAFAMFYVVLGVPIARLADRRPRRVIIAIGVLLWSVMTVGCGFAKNFWQLFVTRIGVGIGEATLQPSAYSMLADYFPPQKLGRAIGAYSTGLFLGGGLALIVGGAVIKSLSGGESFAVPLLGELRSWQLAFLVVGTPGVLVSLLVLCTVREPPRRGLRNKSPQPAKLGELWSFMRQNRRTLTSIFAAFSFGGIMVVGYVAWIPEFIRRTYGWDIAEVGFVFGAQMAVFGTAGALTGGWLLDWLTRRGRPDAALRAAIFVFLLLVPLTVLPPLMPRADLGVALLGPMMFTIGLQQGYSPVALQLIAPNEIRAQVIAVYFLVAQIAAIGFGPTIIAVVTDYVFQDDASLRWSMAIVGGTCSTLALLCLIWGRAAYCDSVRRAQAWLDT